MPKRPQNTEAAPEAKKPEVKDYSKQMQEPRANAYSQSAYHPYTEEFLKGMETEKLDECLKYCGIDASQQEGRNTNKKLRDIMLNIQEDYKKRDIRLPKMWPNILDQLGIDELDEPIGLTTDDSEVATIDKDLDAAIDKSEEAEKPKGHIASGGSGKPFFQGEVHKVKAKKAEGEMEVKSVEARGGKIFMSLGATVNIGNFENYKVDVGVELPLDFTDSELTEAQKAIQKARTMVETELVTEVKKFSQRKNGQ